MRTLPATAVISAALLLAGCTSATPTAAPTAAVSPSPSKPGDTGPSTAECPATASSGPNTRQGTGHGVEMWALLFPTTPELHRGTELKIVIRLTGPDAAITATGPKDQVIKPTWGPEYHGGSNFDHPGAEFGTGWVFPVAGCWRLRAINTDGYADLVLRVV